MSFKVFYEYSHKLLDRILYHPDLDVGVIPTPPPVGDFLLQEDGSFLLQEDGSKIILT